MKNSINEHHDDAGRSWPAELLSMDVDTLLDTLGSIDPTGYKIVEDIITRNMQTMMHGQTIGTSSVVPPSFNELGQSEEEQRLMDIEDKIANADGPGRDALMQMASEIRNRINSKKNIDTFKF